MKLRALLLAGASLLVLASCGDDEPLPVYSDEELAYFSEIAFGTEFGAEWDTLFTTKWTEDVRIGIEGYPSERQIETVHDVAAELDDLVQGIRVVALAPGAEEPANVRIGFVTYASMVGQVGEVAQNHVGFFRFWHGGDRAIDSARAWIAYDRGSEARLDHTIREELTQLLGLGQDSWSYEESIFYQGVSEVTEFAPIDRSVIRMLYDPRIAPDMLRARALTVLAGDG